MKLNITGKSTIVMQAARSSPAKKPTAVRDAGEKAGRPAPADPADKKRKTRP